MKDEKAMEAKSKAYILVTTYSTGAKSNCGIFLDKETAFEAAASFKREHPDIAVAVETHRISNGPTWSFCCSEITSFVRIAGVVPPALHQPQVQF